MSTNYQCELCDRFFGSILALNQHIDSSDAHAFPCPHCKDIYTNDAALHHHISDEHYICAICPQNFLILEDRNWHENEHHLYCRVHARSFGNANDLRTHLSSADHIGRTVKCLCGSGFPKLSFMFLHIEENGCPDINAHILTHITALIKSKKGYHLSEEVGPLFDDPAGTLRSWILQPALLCWSVSSNVGELFECFGCDSAFKRETQLMMHLYAPDTSDPRKNSFQCIGCHSQFAKGSGLLQHKESGSCMGQ